MTEAIKEKKSHSPWKGKKLSSEHKKKISESLEGYVRDPRPWDNLSIHTKHNRIRKLRPKPEHCEVCNRETKKLDLTSLDHKYSPNPKTWRWKCRKCHGRYDKRFR